jgi:hypothetical protein
LKPIKESRSSCKIPPKWSEFIARYAVLLTLSLSEREANLLNHDIYFGLNFISQMFQVTSRSCEEKRQRRGTG